MKQQFIIQESGMRKLDEFISDHVPPQQYPGVLPLVLLHELSRTARQTGSPRCELSERETVSGNPAVLRLDAGDFRMEVCKS